MNDNHPTPAAQTRQAYDLQHSEYSAQLKALFPDHPVKVQREAKQRMATKLTQIFGGKK